MPTTTGTRKRVTATFKLDTTLTDPGAVTVKVLSPDGLVATATPIKTGTGVYFHDVDLDDPGRWTVRFVGTSPVIATAETVIDVAPSPFYPFD